MEKKRVIPLIIAVIFVISVAYFTIRVRADRPYIADNQWFYSYAFSEPCDGPSDSISIYVPSEKVRHRQLLEGVEYGSAEAVWDTTVHVDDFVDLIKQKF